MDDALARDLLVLCREEQASLVELYGNPELIAELEETGAEGRRIAPGASFSLIALAEAARRAPISDLVHHHLAVHAYVGWRLERVVLAYGWPGADLVGVEAAEAFSAMLAHADDRPALRLRAVGAAVNDAGRLRSDIDSRQYGHVVDRTQVIMESPQIYGTYLLPTPDGVKLVWPVHDEAELDARRESIRLPPLRHDIKLYESGATAGAFLAPTQTPPTSQPARTRGQTSLRTD